MRFDTILKLKCQQNVIKCIKVASIRKLQLLLPMELSESLAFLLRYHTKGAQKCFKLTTLQRFFMTEILPYKIWQFSSPCNILKQIV